MENNFKKITKFTDLITWQEGHKLVLMIYDITKNFPKEDFQKTANQTTIVHKFIIGLKKATGIKKYEN